LISSRQNKKAAVEANFNLNALSFSLNGDKNIRLLRNEDKTLPINTVILTLKGA